MREPKFRVWDKKSQELITDYEKIVFDEEIIELVEEI